MATKDPFQAVPAIRSFRESEVCGASTDRWMAILAHELRNPLSVIGLALEELRPTCSTASASCTREMAIDAARQMRSIIEDVLDFCRSRRVATLVRSERMDLSCVITSAVNSVRPLLDGHAHHLTVVLPQHPVILESQPSRIEQILTNLLTNAGKYTDHGGRIFLTVESTSCELLLRVTDNGIGMPAELIPHVFDLYRRGSSERAVAACGMGIGLAVVKSLVELLGGTIAAYSEGLGRGLEFVVRLPLRCHESQDCI